MIKIYYLHTIESQQDRNDKGYYTDPLIKEVKRDIVKIKPKTIAVEKLINDIKKQIGIDVPKQIASEDFYYISDFKIFSNDYLKRFVEELKEIKLTLNSELLIDTFDSLINSYSNEKWVNM